MAKTMVLRLLLGIGLLAVAVLSLPLAHAQDYGDPPGRVARLNHFSGGVTFSPAGTEDWLRAHVNRPLVSGDRVWVEPGARAELHIESTVVRLDGGTSAGFLRFDDDVAQLKLTQGTLNLRVRTMTADQAYEIDTPNLAFSIQEPGAYRIDVAPDGVTTVTVRDGSGVAYGERTTTTIAEGQQVSFMGTDLAVAAAAGNPPFDAFDQWAAGRDRAEDASTAARYVSRDMIGYEQLDAYGYWRSTPQYGMVWTPHRVAAGWAPYRSGHWAWIMPWGWTWIDDAPWGFAPYHYGRWAYIGRTWCWVPGTSRAMVRPVYAPALVVFVGGPYLQFSLSAGQGVGWLPLAPGEAYRPAYRSSPTYLRNINRTVIVNREPDRDHDGYRNRHAPHAITAVPAGVFTAGGAVMPAAKSVAPDRLDRRAFIGAPAVVPKANAMTGGTRVPVPAAARDVFGRSVVSAGRDDGERRRVVRSQDRLENWPQDRPDQRHDERRDGRGDPRDRAGGNWQEQHRNTPAEPRRNAHGQPGIAVPAPERGANPGPNRHLLSSDDPVPPSSVGIVPPPPRGAPKIEHAERRPDAGNLERGRRADHDNRDHRERNPERPKDDRRYPAISGRPAPMEIPHAPPAAKPQQPVPQTGRAEQAGQEHRAGPPAAPAHRQAQKDDEPQRRNRPPHEREERDGGPGRYQSR